MQSFEEIVVIGMGLMGGSFALALKKAGYKSNIIGCDLSKEALMEAEKRGIVDSYCERPKKVVKNAQLIVMALPVGDYAGVLQEIAMELPENVIITDLGSVKGYVATVANKYLPKETQFIGGHPMAGSEKGGIASATSSLYENAFYFLTPNKTTKPDTIKKLQALVQSIGALPVIIDAQEHDKIAAYISHIPHLTAVLLTKLLNEEKNASYLPFAGGGFRDTTRIASGNPKMWRDIFLFNKREIIKAIKALEILLHDFRLQLQKGEHRAILKSLEEAKKVRDGIPYAGGNYLPQVHDLIIDIQDQPMALARVANVIGQEGLNIKEIEIMHARHGEQGAVRIGFATVIEQQKAYLALKDKGFTLEQR